MFDERTSRVKKELISFGGLVESMIEKSVDGLMKRDRKLLETVIDKDELKANASELRLDELCISIIAQYEPKAKDLRTILMIMRMNSDLERIGDHAVNIAESALDLLDKPPVKQLIDIPRMAEVARGMVSDSLQAFVNEDSAQAKAVCERDNIVDGLADQVLRELATHMASDVGTIDRALRLLKISGNLERIADLSTNIGEEVIFMVEGRVIKHGGKQ